MGESVFVFYGCTGGGERLRGRGNHLWYFWESEVLGGAIRFLLGAVDGCEAGLGGPLLAPATGICFCVLRVHWWRGTVEGPGGTTFGTFGRARSWEGLFVFF